MNRTLATLYYRYKRRLVGLQTIGQMLRVMANFRKAARKLASRSRSRHIWLKVAQAVGAFRRSINWLMYHTTWGPAE